MNFCNCDEEWIFIENDKYILSSKGRLFDINKNKFIGSNFRGYISSSKFGGFHRLVCKYFLNDGKDYKGLVTDHRITIRNHNCICNLKTT